MQDYAEPVVLVVRDPEDVDEAKALLIEAGYNPIETIFVKKIDAGCYLGRGKLEELRKRLEELGVRKLCIFDELKPRHFTCLIKELGVDVLDKVMLILEIFSRHAGSKEAKLQIELAKLRHQLPLVRDWLRRAKLRELPGFLGAGEYAIDAYYRHIRARIARISRELEKLRERRAYERTKRRESGLPHVAIAGYTNSGKTTLFNALTNLRKPTGSELFTTLSPKTYAVRMCGSRVALIDTVGFIRKIPLEIVEAFRAVLEEIADADAILLVVDASEPRDSMLSKLYSSLRILREIGASGRPMIIALNKIDLLNGISIQSLVDDVWSAVRDTEFRVVDVVPISALKRLNLDKLKEGICRALASTSTNFNHLCTSLG